MKRITAVIAILFLACANGAQAEEIIPPPPPSSPAFPPQMGAWELTVYNAKRLSDFVDSLVLAADEIKGMTDLDKRRAATDVFAENLKRLLDMFAEMRVPRDWCLASETDLPTEPSRARERLLRMKPCLSVLMEEAKAQENEKKPDYAGLEDTAEKINAFIKEKQKNRLKSQQETAMGQFWETLQEWIKTLIKKFFGVAKPAESAGQTFDKWVSAAVAAAFAALAGYLAFKIYRRLKRIKRRDEPKRGLALSGSAPLSALIANSNWAEADRLAAQGKNREAFRLYFHAWMSVLSEVFGSPLPRYDETNREWLARAMPFLSEEAGGNSKTAADAFDRHWYGLVEPDGESVAKFRKLLTALADGDK